jgi:hypothetical protein
MKDVLRALDASALQSPELPSATFAEPADRFCQQSFDRDRIRYLALKKRQIDPILGAFNVLPDEPRQKLDEVFRNVLALATPAGVSLIIEEARFRGIEIVEELRPITSLLDKAAWACLRHRSVLEAAGRLAVRETLPGRYWKRRLPVNAMPGADLFGAAKSLEAAISSYFTGRGAGECVPSRIPQARQPPPFLCLPRGFPAAPLAWTARGLGSHSYRPAFELVFVFDDTAGWLDIYCEAGMRTAQRLRSLFADSAIALRDLPDSAKPAYALEGLKSRPFQFIRPPDSPIKDVRLKRLGFLVLGEPTRIAIETDPTRDRFALHREIERLISIGGTEP